MRIRRVVLTEEPYPICVVSGKQLDYFSPVFEVTRDTGDIVYVDAATFNAMNKTIE